MDIIETERPLSKKDKLTALVNSVLTNTTYREEIEKISHQLQLTQKDIVKAYLDYNLDINAFGNEIYDSIANKMVLHLHNLVKNSWHQERQDCISHFIKKINVQNIIDVGFGVPSKYIKDFILPEKKSKLTLFDLATPSIQFASHLLELWDPSWKTVISIKQGDMCDVDTVGEFDAYLFQDSIEHVPDPSQCLKDYVKIAPQHAFFILSIPIGPIITAHYMAWNSDLEATLWLNNCGLRIIESKSIWVNPDVDLFAEPLGHEHHNFMVLCEKT